MLVHLARNQIGAMMSRVTTAVFAAIMLVVPAMAVAQSQWPVQEGQRVRVNYRPETALLTPPFITVGTVVRVTADSLFLGGGPDIPLDDMVSLEISDGGRRRLAAGAVIGGATGFAAGALISLARNACVCVTENCPACAGQRYQGLDFAITVKATAIGVLFGGLFGASRKERWVSVPLDFRLP